MKWSDIQFQPTKRVLRQFAGAWLVFWLALAARQWFKLGDQKTALILAAIAIGVGGAGLVLPRMVRWLYIGCTIVAFPIGWVVSQIMVGLMYYVILTPVALFFRLRGRDVLYRKPSPNRTTFWLPKSQPDDVRRYFRQY